MHEKYLPAALLDGFIVDFFVAFIFLGCLVCLENTCFGIHILFSFKLWSFLVTLSFGWGALNLTSVKDLQCCDVQVEGLGFMSIMVNSLIGFAFVF